MTPATFDAVVYKWSHATSSVTVITRARTPNRYNGDNGQIDQLVCDLNCIDGAPWAEATFAPERDDLHPDADVVPPLAHEVLAAIVREVNPDEMEAVLANQQRRIGLLRSWSNAHPDDSSAVLVLAAEEAYLKMLTGCTVDACPLAPPDLPDWVAQQPAANYLLRAVDLVLRPFPDRQLLKHREIWWPSWA